MDAAIGCDDPHQPDGGRGSLARVIGAIGTIGGAYGDDGLGQAGMQEVPDRDKAGVIHPHAKLNALLNQIGHQPACRVAPVQDQQVIGRQSLQMIEQHLSFAHAGRIQLGRQGQLQAGQVERKGDGLAHAAASGILKEKTQFRGIGRHDAQAVPAGHVPMAVHQGEQTGIEASEGGMGEIPTGFGKCLSADQTQEVGLIRQMGEEGIEFVLNAGLEAREHGGDQDGKGQNPLSEKGTGFESRRTKQFVGMKIAREPYKNTLVLRSS